MLSSAERRLTAIMFTDVVGYGAMTQRNEDLALELLQMHREMVRPMFRSHGGNEIKTMGDAFLVEFQSALQAVKCAIAIQTEMKAYNGSVDPSRKIQIRIGLHIGDVVFEQNDVYGDGVNLASRVYANAQPGGICLTRSVYDQVYNKLDVHIRRLGPQRLKSIQVPVELFAINLEETPVLWQHRRLTRVIALILLIGVIGAGYWAVTRYENTSVNEIPDPVEVTTQIEDGPRQQPDSLITTGNIPDQTAAPDSTPRITPPENTPAVADPQKEKMEGFRRQYAAILRSRNFSELSSVLSRGQAAGDITFGTKESFTQPEGALVAVVDVNATASSPTDVFFLYLDNMYINLRTDEKISDLAARYAGDKREIWVKSTP